MTAENVHKLLSHAKPLTPEGADLVLDLREILLGNGHPGDCVQCFFALLGNLEQPRALAPLRHWLETHLEVSVRINGEHRESLPVHLKDSHDLIDYCHKITDIIRNDRTYSEERIELSFEYR